MSTLSQYIYIYIYIYKRQLHHTPYVPCFFARAVDATKEANGVDDTKYGEFGGKPAGGYGGYTGGGYGGYQGGPSRDPRILSGGNGGRHPCPVEGSGHCSPPGAETEVKLQN
jgi:hypothetical protein